MKQVLLDNLKILQGYKHSKEELMLRYVSERLNKSYETYQKELSQGLSFLEQKHEKSLLKRLNKLK